MQLVVEPEPMLDIEINMSLENMQNITNDDVKIVNVETDDISSKNYAENTDVSDDKQISGDEQNICEMPEAVADIPMDIDHSEAELSNVDLSHIINEKNNIIEIESAKSEESQINCLVKDVNNLESEINVKYIEDINKTKEIAEDDYLEDDIISISEEPFQQISTPEKESEHINFDKNYEICTENFDKVTTAEEVFEDKNDECQHLQLESSTIDDDVLEVSNTLVQCNTNTEFQPEIEKDSIVKETEGNPNMKGEKEESKLQMETEERLMEIGGSSLFQDEKAAEVPMNADDKHKSKEQHFESVEKIPIGQAPEETDKIQGTDKSESSSAQCEKKINQDSTTARDTVETIVLAEPAAASENVASSIGEAKQVDIDIIEESNETSSENYNKADLPQTENKKDSEDTVAEEITKRTILPEDDPDVAIEKITKSTNSCRDIADSQTNQTDKLEIVKETETPCNPNVEETNVLKEIAKDNFLTVPTGTSLEINETSEFESDQNETKTMAIDKAKDKVERDSPVVVEDDVMIISNDDANDTIESSSPIVLKDDMVVTKSEIKNQMEDNNIIETESLVILKNDVMIIANNESKNNINKNNDKVDTDSPVVLKDNVMVISNNEGDDKIETDSSYALKDDIMEIDEPVKETKIIKESTNSPSELNDKMRVDDVVDGNCSENKESTKVKDPVLANVVDKNSICKLSNTLDILSDDEEETTTEDLPKVEAPKCESPKPESSSRAIVNNKQCINIEDDDDIMLIDEETNKTSTNAPSDTTVPVTEPVAKPDVNLDSNSDDKTIQETSDLFESRDKKDKTPPIAAEEVKQMNTEINIKEKTPELTTDQTKTSTPLIPDNFVKTAKKKLSDMTRDELEEFCILKIVESIIDRSSLSDIKNKLKTMAQGVEEYRKKAAMLSKQNRDLQVVLKSVQEEQKKVMGNTPVTPLKITRSVGMQVYMEKTIINRKKGPQQNNNNRNANNVQNKNLSPLTPGPASRIQKQPNQAIPVPRLVPVSNNPALKTPNTNPLMNQMNTPNKNPPNGILKTTTPPVLKAEKRQYNKITASPTSSVTVDLTDDEPPTKMSGGPKTSPAAPVRLVSPQTLMAPQRQAFGATNVSSPRKVYIPISGPQGQALRPGQTIMLKPVPAPGIRQRCPTPQVQRVEPNNVRVNRIAARHPAPLPFAMKQYQPPNWKSLPPPPDLKLSKVENGIVISWKIEGVPEDSYEEIASYQLFAYQETSQPPSTTLWKKIGDVKALPLPMACTLTQFMAGFKYYFAVRAVDIRSRLGPFSLPGSILLINKSI